jgi:hypothetical protein
MQEPTRGRKPRPMNVFVRRGSKAEAKYRALAAAPGLQPEQIAPGIQPTPAHDLLYRGGRTIQQLTFANFYVAGSVWQQSDIQSIDHALAAAMSDPSLNNVIVQYFSGPITSKFAGSQKLPGAAPPTMSQGDVESLVGDLAGKASFDAFDLTSTVVNFMLPRGTVLNDDPAHSAAHASSDAAARPSVVPEEEEVDSLHGLGGYHGSVQIGNRTIYYAVGVYSEVANGQTNGIPVFDAPWKNVVATFYHELNEARTDPDVESVIRGGPASLLGWMSKQGEECGDFPVAEADPLTEVFQQVAVAGGGTAPVQFQYSNFEHGPQGPVSTPDPPSARQTRPDQATRPPTPPAPPA